MTAPIDPYAIPDDQVEAYLAIKQMTEALAQPQPPDFFVALGRYYVDGEPYRATGLAVSPTRTPNLRQTQTGFACDAYFAPDLLKEQNRRGKQVLKGLVEVKLEVRLEDIWMVTVQAAGSEEQVVLFQGTPTWF